MALERMERLTAFTLFMWFKNVQGSLHLSSKMNWYNQSVRQYGRDLLKWGSRIDEPGYDGDMLLLDQGDPVFAVVWSRGCLYINRHLKAVAWCPIGTLSSRYCFRMKNG